ncbi:MAG: CotH kinase family protein [Bacteroidales bacterium]|nr:CotH kinase family protein [Bacteroidales bacterium]
MIRPSHSRLSSVAFRTLFFCLGLLYAVFVSAQSGSAYDSRLDSLRLPAPVFSQEHGFYDEAFSLVIQPAEGYEKAAIVYTLDGGDPGVEHGIRYTEPVRIAGTSVVRACLISDQEGIENSRITTRTYLFIDDILQQSQTPEGYPVKWGPYAQLSGYAKADYEMDPELCNDPVYAEKVRQGLLSLPVVSVVTDRDNLFSAVNDPEKGGIYYYTDPPTGYSHFPDIDPGTKWLRAASVEMFDAAGEISWQADCGLRLHGGHSRLAEKTPKHSFRLVFKEKYGSKKLKKVNIFGETQAKKLDNIVLRAGFCNTWVHANSTERNNAAYTRDAWAKEIQRLMGHPASHQRFAHLFLNGIYWGLYNPTERIDAKWCEEYLNGAEEEYDVIKVEDNPQTVMAGDGNMEAWQELFDLSSQASDERVYQRILGMEDGIPNGRPLLDVVNFIDYMIINIYGGNTDWDRHNWLAVRNRVTPGSGFKMLCWDSEHVLKSLKENVGYGEKRKLCPSLLFGNLMKNPGFVRLVGDRIQRHCYQSGVLTPQSAAAVWISLSEEIYQALDCEAARWGDYRRDVHRWNIAPYELYTKTSHYDPLQEKMLTEILPGRRDVFIGQMRSLGLFPDIDAPVVSLNGEVLITDTFALGDRLALSTTQGKIYYMTDGSDPVRWESDGQGRLRPEARIWQTETFLEDSCLNLAARSFHDGTWSALTQACLRIPVPQTPLNSISDGFRHDEFHLRLAADVSVMQFRCDLPCSGQLEVSVHDLSGRLLSRHSFRLEAGPARNAVIESPAMVRGIYLVKYCFLSDSGHEQLAAGSLKYIRL